MRKATNYLLSAAFLLCSVLGPLVLPAVVEAAGTAELAQDGAQNAGSDNSPAFGVVVETVANILIFVVGLAAVIAVIVGAIRYTTANGDQGQLTTAKNTILYAIVGLVLAIATGAIVNFVLGQF